MGSHKNLIVNTDQISDIRVPTNSNLVLPTKEEFLTMAAHIKKFAGINLPLSEKNRMLIAGRLQRIQRRGILGSYRELIVALEQRQAAIVSEFVFALTTNTTSFFREKAHFDFLLKNLSTMMEKRDLRQPLRFWCSPCSTGEEAFSLAMVICEALGDDPAVKILATDINEYVLNIARHGEYPLQKLQEIPVSAASRFTSKQHHGEEQRLKMHDSLVKLIQFGQFNLLLDYPFDHKFDVIFCRNVLIYFERQDSEYVVCKMRDQLRPGGYLFLGHSETSAGNLNGLKRVGPAIFQRD